MEAAFHAKLVIIDTELLAGGIPREAIRHYGFAFRGKEVLIG